MTIAHVQPLNIFAASKACDFLREADMIVTDAKLLFLYTNDLALSELCVVFSQGLRRGQFVVL